MSRRDTERLIDIAAAIEAIESHLTRGGLDDGLVYDAVRARLIEIGEAIKGIDPQLLAQAPEVSWQDAAGMRDRLAHRYFDTSHGIVHATVANDLPVLRAAVVRLLERDS